MGLGFGLMLQADHAEACQIQTQFWPVQDGAIALDDAGIFQSAYAAKTGRRGDTGAACQLRIGDAPVRLKLPKDSDVDRVEFGTEQEGSKKLGNRLKCVL